LELLQNEESVIDWSLRLRLAKDIAKGVAFLHSCSPPIVHRDLKSPNVLVLLLSASVRVRVRWCLTALS
jgi:serine/threonine protein kinase